MLLFFFAMAFPVHAETSAEPSTKINGYVSDLKIRAAFNLATDIPGFVFDPAKTTYSDDDELVLYNGVAPKIIASVTEDDLYYQICINGVLELITNQVYFFLSILKLSLSALTQAGIVAPTAANAGKSPQYKQSVAGHLPQ